MTSQGLIACMLVWILVLIPQLNDGYSYRLGGDLDELVSYGWWIAELAQQWVKDADVILI